ANDPHARPTAEQLRDLLTSVQLTPPTATYIPPPRQTNDDTPTVHTAQPPRKKRFFGLLRIQHG
ncbi:MAG: serine/threonine protein kinase, partial [Actinoplanes sp.]